MSGRAAVKKIPTNTCELKLLLSEGE
jgi:hypothetical protein